MTIADIAPGRAAVLDQRRAHAEADVKSIPVGAARCQAFNAQLRATKVKRNGKDMHELTGYASTVNQPYTMYDMFGEYTETVARHAFDNTLAANPDVAFLLNHRGMTMARTANGTLELWADDTGLGSKAFVNPERTDVKDLVTAIDDGDITEMSFAFVIVRGSWSPDYMSYTIEEVDIDRGDTSAVNYGANPYTSIAARQQDLLRDLRHLDGGALRQAAAITRERLGEAAPAAPSPVADPSPEVVSKPKGMGLTYAKALVELEG